MTPPPKDTKWWHCYGEPARWVYLMHQISTSWFKIGSSKHPGRRATQLQVGSPLPIDVIEAFPYATIEAAEAVEILIRELLIEYEFAEPGNGEWIRFFADEDDERDIAETAIVNFGMCSGLITARFQTIESAVFNAGTGSQQKTDNCGERKRWSRP